MFNWFRRKTKKTESEQVPEPTDQATSPQTETPPQETTQEDYLTWAKTAYKNIQQTQITSTSRTTETETPQEITTEEKVTSQIDTETISETQTTEVPKSSPSTDTPEETVPAWMQKSDRLEVLKETAIETETVEDTAPLTFDEEFVWSAKVLAAQGRA
ncbi:MAG: signal recognition particle-docking protein FtsY, partial [Crocosphaera sp.]